jgi:DNA-binding NarL/FixJ family response regulator
VIRVLLVDDQALIRAGFRALLEAESDIDVVGEGATGVDAVDQAVALRPDIALIDIQMPEVDGIEATRRIAAEPGLAGVRVVILTNYGLDEHVYAALRAGASGFLVKDTEPADLLHGIRVAARGDALLSPAITRRLIAEYVSRPEQGRLSAAFEALTNRERQVVGLAARGMTNDEIATHMEISLATAKTHVSRAMTKLQARDRAQMVVYAFESGFVVPGSTSVS